MVGDWPEISWQFIENSRKIDSEKQGKYPQLILIGQGIPGSQATSRLCYTGIMFIHRIRITGSSDRGAWLWRTWLAQSAHA
jgi:hypothetical protein